MGYEARDYLRNILLGKDVIIQTEKEGKWGRYLVKIKYNDLDINQHLIDKGYAVEHDGGKRLPWIL